MLYLESDRIAVEQVKQAALCLTAASPEVLDLFGREKS